MGWGFDIFQKFAVKFPAHGQIIPVKWNQISSPRAAHYTAKYPKAGSKKGTIKISPNKNLKSLFILRCCITKVTRKGRETFGETYVRSQSFSSGLAVKSSKKYLNVGRRKNRIYRLPGRTRSVKCPIPGPAKTIKSPPHALPPPLPPA